MDFEPTLIAEIDDEIKQLSQMAIGTDEYKVAVDGLTKLMDRAVEIYKVNIGKEERAETQKFENTLKEKQAEFDRKSKQTELDYKLRQSENEASAQLRQMDDEVKDRLIKNCIATAGIVLPALITIWGTLKSLNFEKEGTVTTIVGRGFINKLLPKK